VLEKTVMNDEVASRDFPQLCEGCLGTNPYVRMQRNPGGGTCKMCSKPFETFKWRPGRGESYRRTEVNIFYLPYYSAFEAKFTANDNLPPQI
jgi:hypothetical protein